MTRQPPSDKRLGRNEQCPCRSGLKYKKCHGANNPNKQPRAISPDLLIRRQHAIQHQRELQQGLGSPIITETFQGERVVAVGDRIFHSARWKTFHDFLFYYVIEVVGLKWFQAEELKDESARHPIFQLDRRVVAWLKENKIGDGEVKSAPMTGATAAYLRFAYHLYLLNHNGGLPEKLLARLRDKGQFDGAQHELYVAATFIKAGFKIEFEDESDSTRSHCEFTVTHKETNCRFSVEAKARAVQSNLMRGLLSKALAKDADHKRIVWIAINAPASDHAEGHAVLQGALQELRERESTLKLDGKEVPPLTSWIPQTLRPVPWSKGSRFLISNSTKCFIPSGR